MAYLRSQWTTNVQIKFIMMDGSIYRLFVLNRAWKRVRLQIIIFEHFWSTRDIVELKTRFETWITRKDVIGVRLFHLSYLVTLMAYLCSHRTPRVQVKYFMVDSSIYILVVLNSAWKRDSLQMMIFVNDVGHGWIKNAFWNVNNKKWLKWCKFDSLFISNNTFGLPVIIKDTKCPSLVFYVWFVDLHTSWAKFVLETWFPPNDDIRKCLFGMKNSWTKNAFWEVNNKKWRKLCVCFTFLI
jgi:hypothetical protein